MSGVEQVRENLASLASHLHDNDILRWTMAEVGTELYLRLGVAMFLYIEE